METIPLNSILTIHAMSTAEVYFDGHLILPFTVSLQDWKKPQTINLNNFLTTGEHEIYITVFNKNGPALLLAYCEALKLFTGEDWEASLDRTDWAQAVPVDRISTPELSKNFTSPTESFLSLIPFYLPLFVVIFFLTIFLHFKPDRIGWIRKLMSNPSKIRWLLLGAWTVLAMNNIAKIPLYIGFDVKEHYDYIMYVAEKWRVPLPNEGWQMFQSPLYYLISAALYSILSQFFSIKTVAIMLRIIPLISGAMQVEISYRAVRYIFPTRWDLQVMGTIIGGLLPMNLYISQVVGNEPLSGILSATVVIMGLRLLQSGRDIFQKKHLVFLGAVLGFALLTKVTAVLLIPPVMFLLIYVMLKNGQSIKNIIAGLLLVLSVTFIISGWYYLRNWIELGKPFIGGWESSRQIVWWQDPGYRTMQDSISFGKSLTYPIYSAVNGFWDSIYSTLWLDGFIGSITSYEFRPPWNYNFMLSGALLALLPTAGIIIGILATVLRPSTASQNGQLFSVYCIGIYFIALFYLYSNVPIYSTAKATYTLGLIPCYAIMCVTGLNFIMSNIYMRAGIYALFSCWAIAAYLSYLVL
ncbi:MAG: hypothetical protein HY755_12130 [Nitrospirae bacterium]|nr:hypothetical protein [Nitrospirota bacterium]